MNRRKKALIIALSDYEKLQSLDFCIKDGESIRNILSSLGYHVSTENVIIGDMDGENLRKAILDFFINNTVEEEDTLLFYFSGHGILDSDGDGYLCSSDIDPDSPIKKGFALDDLTNMMNKSRSKRIVLFLDCCYSGTARISKGRMVNPAELGKAAILKSSKALRLALGRCILAACSETGEAYGLKEYGQSIFTYYVIKGLEENNNSIDNMGNVTVDTLAAFVSKAIMSLPKDRRLKQTPIKKSESSIEIVLASYPHLAKSLETNIVELLSTGRIAEFNNFRHNATPYIMLNLQNADLSFKNLQGANLSNSFMQHVNLQSANLNNASLERSKLIRANLRAANLEDANLQGANLREANLEDANLEGAKLEGSKLNLATLSNVTMKFAGLEKAELFGANLIHAKLQQCNLQGSDLTEAILRNADCSESNFSYSYLENADLRSATLQGANFMFAEMTGATFAFANMMKADLSRAELVGNDLSRTILENAILTDTYLSDADLRWSNLKNAEMIRIDLQDASLENADLTGANLQGASLENADLTGANLQGANLQGASLENADLTGANLHGANLQGASLENADLTGANLHGANFMFAQVEGAHLDNADKEGVIGLNS